MTAIKDTTVKYVNKDFQSYKRDLMRYAQAHFSGAFQDYNETSPGMMLLELQAFLADNLSYYMDQQFLEIKQDTARQIENIEAFSKMRGYKPKGKRSARVILSWIVEFPAQLKNGKYVPVDPQGVDLTSTDGKNKVVLRAGSQAVGPSGIMFETLDDLDFGSSTDSNPQDIRVATTDDNNNPLTLAVMRKVEAVAARTVTENLLVGDFVPYTRIQLGQSDVQEILDVYDSDGNQWYEVDYLSQNSVFTHVENSGSDSDVVPYVLKARVTPRRFIVDHVLSSNSTFLQFGNGDGLKFDDDIIPNVAQLSLPISGRRTFANFILDPQNFLKTRTLGLSPYNTTLTVRYRFGGGSDTNVPAFSINKKAFVDLVFGFVPTSDVERTSINTIKSTVEVVNMTSSEGGGESETAVEILSNADGFFAAQGRAVTREDFVAHVLSMPSKFGRPEKAYTKPSEYNPMGVDLHILSRDSNGNFSRPTEQLIRNIKTYMNKLRMITEGITILPANVMNFGIEFGIVVSPKFNRSEVLMNCMNTLKNYFVNDNMQIGMPIVKSDVQAQLQNVNGVISVYKLQFVRKFSEGGSPYSGDMLLNFDEQDKNGIIYCPEDTIFELRYPDQDIIGESK